MRCGHGKRSSHLLVHGLNRRRKGGRHRLHTHRNMQAERSRPAGLSRRRSRAPPRSQDQSRRRTHAVELAARENLKPRLNRTLTAYAHARQFKRMRKALRTLKGYTGRVMCDLRRQLGLIPVGALRETVLDTLVLVSRLLHQLQRAAVKSMPCMNLMSASSPRARPRSGTNLAPRSVLPRRSRKASWWACVCCPATLMTGTRCQKRLVPHIVQGQSVADDILRGLHWRYAKRFQ